MVLLKINLCTVNDLIFLISVCGSVSLACALILRQLHYNLEYTFHKLGSSHSIHIPHQRLME